MVKETKIVSKGEEFIMLTDDDFKLPNRKIGINTGYASFSLDGVPRLVYREVIGAKEGECVDHINRNRLDNRKENLRIATRKENARNRRYKGYNWMKREKKWRAQIKVDGVKIHLGYFTDESEAGKAYIEAHVKYFGEFSPYFKRELTGR